MFSGLGGMPMGDRPSGPGQQAGSTVTARLASKVETVSSESRVVLRLRFEVGSFEDPEDAVEGIAEFGVGADVDSEVLVPVGASDDMTVGE